MLNAKIIIPSEPFIMIIIMKEVDVMEHKDFTYKLVNRTRISTSIDNEILKAFDKLAVETRLNKSKLYDEALTDLLIKYEKKTQI